MTGWGQYGPLAHTAGHDITYLALTGALHAIGPAGGPPQIPLNLVGDVGGGSAYLVMGILAALLEARATGVGRTVDAAIVDGASHLLTGTYGMLAAGTWRDERGVNLLDGGAPFYAVYETADGEYMAVGALEPHFYRALLAILGSAADPADQHDRSRWPGLRAEFERLFRTRTQTDWTGVFQGNDACVAPVLGLRDAAQHPHIRHRASLIEDNGILQPAPAPRFSGATARVGRPPSVVGQHTIEVLEAAGVVDMAALLDAGAAVQRSLPAPSDQSGE